MKIDTSKPIQAPWSVGRLTEHAVRWGTARREAALKRRGRSFDERGIFGYREDMTQLAQQMLQRIINFCNDKWVEADQAQPSAYESADTHNGRKAAYNDVFQHARTLLGELSEKP